MIAEKAEKTLILLEDKDFFFSQSEIDEIIELHNDGLHYTTIATQVKRDPVEVILCLLDAAEKGKQGLRSLSQAIVPVTQKLDGINGEERLVTAKIIKRKKNRPTVIEIDGKRFVFEPN